MRFVLRAAWATATTGRVCGVCWRLGSSQTDPKTRRSGNKVNFGGFEPPPFGTLYGLEQPVQDLEETGFFRRKIPGNGPEMAILGSRARILSIADVENGIISSSATGVQQG